MKIESYSCDVCGSVKTPSNGWWIANSFEDGRFNIRPWDETELMSGSEHICGETCMAKLITAHMAKWLSAHKEQKTIGTGEQQPPIGSDVTERVWKEIE